MLLKHKMARPDVGKVKPENAIKEKLHGTSKAAIAKGNLRA
jgi:hypothetical protein